MKKCVGLLVCVVGLSVPSFAAEHLVSRSVKVGGQRHLQGDKGIG
jgi:hypothetical protein